MKSPVPFAVLAVALFCLVALSSGDGAGGILAPARTCRPGKVPHNYVVDIPEKYRQLNYTYPGGSCVWASTVSMLRGIGDLKNAEWVRRNRSHGASFGQLRATLRQVGVPYAYTTDGDTKLLRWAAGHNRTCVIGYQTKHAQLFVGWRGGYVYVLNNFSNGTQLNKIPEAEFLSQWRDNYPEPGVAIVALPKGIIPPPEVPFEKGA